MQTLKRGSLFELFVEFDESEWELIYPFDNVNASVKSGPNVYPLFYERFGDNRVIRFYSDTDTWIIGDYKCDISIEIRDRIVYIPSELYITFSLIKSIANE